MKILICYIFIPSVLGQLNFNIQRNFEALDVERDGVIRWNEMLRDFNKKDLNVDGSVSFEEFTARPPPGANPIVLQGSFMYYDKLDGTEDGVLHHSVVNYTYKTLDPDNKGEITFADFERNIKQILKGVALEVQALLDGLTPHGSSTSEPSD